jgi:hypothetical protein
MSTRLFSSPRTASAAAAIAPAKLATTSDSDVRWRTREEGTLEVLVLRDGRATRYVVSDDGTTAPDGDVPLSFSYRWGQRVTIAGWALCFLGIVVGGLAGKEALIGIALLVGVPLFAGGAVASERGQNFEKHLDGGGWHEPTDLHGWVPRTGAQLAAVEQLSDDHDGLAYLRDSGGRTVDVYGMRRGQLVLHWVDEAGNTGVTSTEAYTGPHKLDRVLKWLAALLSLAALVVVLGAHEHRVEVGAALVAALVIVMVAGSRNARRVELGELMKLRVHDAADWIEIRTRLVEDDGD